jgi:putative copper export protein
MDMDDPSLTGWLAAARAVHLAGCLLIAATWLFDRLIAGRAAGWRRVAVVLLWIATPLAAASGVAWFVFVAADMSGVSVPEALHVAVLRLVWSQTRFGHTWQLHAAVWAAGTAMLAVWTATGRGAWAGLILAVGLVGGLAWAGHGSTGPVPDWHMSADLLHLLASAVWPAGLVPFALLLRRVCRSTDADRWEQAARLTRRFSAASLIAVGTLTATGLFDGWCLVGSLDALFHTTYGRVLLLKVGLFTGMVALGAVNLLVHKPRLRLDAATATRQLRWNVAIEVALATGVVTAVGLLGLLEPGRR